MRLAVLADIHGNLPALEAVLADTERLGGADHFIVAGDHVGAPFPAETLTLLRSLPATLIAGNGDLNMVRLLRDEAPAWWHSGQRMGLARWTYRRLSRDSLTYLAGLATDCLFQPDGATTVRVVHGSPAGVSVKLYPDGDPVVFERFRSAGLLSGGRVPPLVEQLAGASEGLVVCGHTHIQWQQRWQGGLVLNPGSVGQPIETDPRARYALLTWRDGEWLADARAIEYDIDAVRRAFHDLGLLNEGGGFARACLRQRETGRNFPGRYVDLASKLAGRAGLALDAGIPDEIWRQAAATFDWESLQA
jgi:predicted phosphodiesterase